MLKKSLWLANTDTLLTTGKFTFTPSAYQLDRTSFICGVDIVGVEGYGQIGDMPFVKFGNYAVIGITADTTYGMPSRCSIYMTYLGTDDGNYPPQIQITCIDTGEVGVLDLYSRTMPIEYRQTSWEAGDERLSWGQSMSDDAMSTEPFDMSFEIVDTQLKTYRGTIINEGYGTGSILRETNLYTIQPRSSITSDLAIGDTLSNLYFGTNSTGIVLTNKVVTSIEDGFVLYVHQGYADQ